MARGRVSQTDAAGSNTGGNGSDAGTTGGVGDIFRTGERITINPAEFGASSGENSGGDNGGGSDTPEQPRKRRGRKPGSKNRTQAAPALSVNGIEFILLSAHEMLAGMTKQPFLRLEQEEAHKVAEAAANVARHYDVSASEKTIDWIALFMALGQVYGTRLVLAGMFRKKKTTEEKTVDPSTPLSSFVQPGIVPQ